jgi:hypothetical protein
MTRLRNDSSRSYPGRSDRQATLWGRVSGSNVKDDRSEVSRGHSTCSHAGKGRTQNRLNVPVRSLDAKRPYDSVLRRRVTDQLEPKTALLEQIVSCENMLMAWDQVKANQGSHGIDKITIDAFPKYAQAHWATIRASLMAETYEPLPVRRVEIPKKTGGKRSLGIPTIQDRLIQQPIALWLVLLVSWNDISNSASIWRRAGSVPPTTANSWVLPFEVLRFAGYNVPFSPLLVLCKCK